MTTGLAQPQRTQSRRPPARQVIFSLLERELGQNAEEPLTLGPRAGHPGAGATNRGPSQWSTSEFESINRGNTEVIERWMHQLARAYAACRAAHAEDRVLVVFDIDGTLLDTRAVEAACAERKPSREAVLTRHGPYRGVVDVARWFGAQPLTRVALNSARPERDRSAIRRCLDVLSQEYRVAFQDDLLHLHRGDPEKDAVAHKRQGLRNWREQGYRIVSVVDSDPQIINALASTQEFAETLFLPTESLMRARRAPARRGLGAALGHVTSWRRSRGFPNAAECTSLCSSHGSTVKHQVGGASCQPWPGPAISQVPKMDTTSQLVWLHLMLDGSVPSDGRQSAYDPYLYGRRRTGRPGGAPTGT
jgi:hypothetical protein